MFGLQETCSRSSITLIKPKKKGTSPLPISFSNQASWLFLLMMFNKCFSMKEDDLFFS